MTDTTTATNTIMISDGLDVWEVEGNVNIQANLKRVLGGRFFKTTFIKADKTERTMTCRLGVAKGLTGTGSKKSDDTVTVFVPSLGQYRSFKLDRLMSITCGKVEVVGVAA